MKKKEAKRVKLSHFVLYYYYYYFDCNYHYFIINIIIIFHQKIVPVFFFFPVRSLWSTMAYIMSSYEFIYYCYRHL